MTNRSGDLRVLLAAWGWGRQRGTSGHRWVCVCICVYFSQKVSFEL